MVFPVDSCFPTSFPPSWNFVGRGDTGGMVNNYLVELEHMCYNSVVMFQKFSLPNHRIITSLLSIFVSIRFPMNELPKESPNPYMVWLDG